jgi:uncharacterized protein YbjT (DUF2867 family)
VTLKLAVAGATGRVGGMLSVRALDGGHAVRCLVRSQSQAKSAPLVKRNAGIVIGDIGHAEALASLCAGADVVLSTVTSTSSRDPQDSIKRVDENGNLALIDAAEAAGVRRLVFVSTPATEPPNEFTSPLELAKRRVEARLAESKLESVVVRLPFIMEVWLSPITGFDVSSGRVRLFGTGEARVHWIGARDAAAVLFEACTRPDWKKKVLTSPGAERASLEEITQRFELALGRSFKRECELLTAIETAYKTATEPKQQSFWAICRKLARGYELPPEPALPAAEQSLAEYVRFLTDSRE